MKIRIGALARWQATHTETELARIGIEGEVVTFKTPENAAQQAGAIEAALLRGEIDVAVHAMGDLSTTQPEGLVITAVSERDNPADQLILQRESYEANQIFKVKKGGAVGVISRIQTIQLLDFRPDIQVQELRGGAATLLEQLRAGAFNAVLIPAADIIRLKLDTSGFETLELNPREFVPAPAQGVLAWQTNRDDLATRRIFRQLHHPEVSACTNIERRVQQLLGDVPLGVSCARDAGGNFHLSAAAEINGELKRCNRSSSTSFGVAEKIVEGLGGNL